jgi:hypothetical protein
MDHPTSFSSLPPELVTKICRDSTLKKKDLTALRLTSKSHGIHLVASEQFANRYFTNIPLVYSRYSLQTFMEICKHSTFGPAVRMVRLSYARFLPRHFEEEIEDMSLLFPSEYGSEERHKYLKNIRRLVQRCDDEEELKRSSCDEGLLAAAFTALSRWHHPLDLGVSSWESHALGRARLHSPDVLRENGHWECDILGTVALLCRAAALSECVVQRLLIQGDVWDNLIDSSAHSLSAMARLPELELDIWLPDVMDTVLTTGLEDMVSKLLRNAIDLKVLYLGSDQPYTDHKYLHKLFSILSTMGVEKVSLTGVDFELSKPFEKRMESLRHLALYDCWIGASFPNVLRSILENSPRLEYFLLSGFSRTETRGKLEFKGAQRVADGINKLVQSSEDHMNDPDWTIAWDSDED